MVLVNNAGTLGQVDYIGNLNTRDFADVFYINTIAPMILMNAFIKFFKNINIEKAIINISSGAAQYPVESWSAYCSSKAALNAFTEVAFKENKEQNNKISIISIAPGVVDTDMQTKIRHTPKEKFSSVDKFLKLKQLNQLDKPELTAQKLVKVIKHIKKYNEAILDLRKL